MNKRLSIVSVSVLLLLLPGVAGAGSKNASDRVIGLLELPQLFGDDVCTPYDPKSLALFEQATSTVPIGEIRVDTPMTIDVTGGCYGIKVGVHLTGGATTAQDFPTRDYGYERPGAIVYARRGNRFKIALPGGAAWIESSAGTLHPMETLVSEGLSYITDRWDGTVCAEPGRPGTCWKITERPEPRPGAMVLGHRKVGGELWFEIKLPSTETCGDPIAAIVPTRGWISAHDNKGEPAIWFYSRGC